jgi:hypothetical protein
MRKGLLLATAVAALGLGASQPASAGGWDDSYCCGYPGGGPVYVHHHIYGPTVYKHVYHYHAPGPRHVNVVQYPGYRYGHRRGDYFGARYYWGWGGSGCCR